MEQKGKEHPAYKTMTHPDELPETDKDIQVKEDEMFEDIAQSYIIYNIPEKSALIKKLKTDKLRVYDKDIFYITRLGDQLYFEEKTRLLDEGKLKTNMEMGKLLQERGLWTDEDEKRIDELRKHIQEYFKERDYLISNYLGMKEKYREKEKEEIQKFDVAVIAAFDELTGKLAEKTSLFGGTVESTALEKQAIGFLIGAVCFDKGEEEYNPENRVWKDINDFENNYLKRIDLESLLAFATQYWNIKSSGEIPFFGESPDQSG